MLISVPSHQTSKQTICAGTKTCYRKYWSQSMYSKAEYTYVLDSMRAEFLKPFSNLKCSTIADSIFHVLNTYFDLWAFSSRLVRSLLFWGTHLRFGSQPLLSSSTISTIVASRYSVQPWNCASLDRVVQQQKHEELFSFLSLCLSLSGCKSSVSPS